MCVMLDQGSECEDSLCEVFLEESSVENMHEIRMLHLGSVLVEKETNEMSTSTSTSMYTCVDTNNEYENGIKFEYDNNNIKINNLGWSKLNGDVQCYKEVTRSNNNLNLKVFRIYDG